MIQLTLKHGMSALMMYLVLAACASQQLKIRIGPANS